MLPFTKYKTYQVEQSCQHIQRLNQDHSGLKDGMQSVESHLSQCDICEIPCQNVWYCLECEFKGCEYKDRDSEYSHVIQHQMESQHSQYFSSQDQMFTCVQCQQVSFRKSEKKMKRVNYKQKRYQSEDYKTFQFSSFDDGFKIIIFKKPNDSQINNYLKNTLEIINKFMQKNIQIYMDQQGIEDTLSLFGMKDLNTLNQQMMMTIMDLDTLETDNFKSENSMIITLGGDGTILYAANNFQKTEVPPILGFYMGTLGFMCNNKVENLENEINGILTNVLFNIPDKYEERIRLEGSLQNSPEQKFLCLNEICINKGKALNSIILDIHVNGMAFTMVQCDGLIISSPTGSTAYNLSAGGPLLYTSVDGILIVPICSYSLSFRPIVLNHTNQVTISINPQCKIDSVHVFSDGRPQVMLTRLDTLSIQISDYNVKCILYSLFSITQSNPLRSVPSMAIENQKDAQLESEFQQFRINMIMYQSIIYI